MTHIVLIKDGELQQDWMWPFAGDRGQSVVDIEGYQFQGYGTGHALRKARRAGKLRLDHGLKEKCFLCRAYEQMPGMVPPSHMGHIRRIQKMRLKERRIEWERKFLSR